MKNPLEMMNSFDWSDKTLLIAEDDHFSYIYLKEILSGTGVKIVYADNGIRAFAECLKNNEISVVLMDIKMPVVNGLESTRLIKKYKPQIKIIAQTAFAMPEDKQKCINAGCDDYISKPVIPEELYTKLIRIFSFVEVAEKVENKKFKDGSSV
jgi:two-component system, cell cycle response regulator DivK